MAEIPAGSRYVAMGSSFAAGPGLPARAAGSPRRAGRSASNCAHLAASAASAGHHAWSATPWTRRFHLSLRGGAPYHPNAAGMAAVAELARAALSREPGERGMTLESP